jgi:hypothetical protein
MSSLIKYQIKFGEARTSFQKGLLKCNTKHKTNHHTKEKHILELRF